MIIWILSIGLGVTFVVAVLALVCAARAEGDANRKTRSVEKELLSKINDNHKQMLAMTCGKHDWKFKGVEDQTGWGWFYYRGIYYEFECSKCGTTKKRLEKDLSPSQLKALQDLGIIDRPKAKPKKKKAGGAK